MNRTQLDTYARTLLDTNGLTDWRVYWRDLTAIGAAGRTTHRKSSRPKRIEFSHTYFALVDEAEQLDTIRHEVAHAVLVEENPPDVDPKDWDNHGVRWKFVAAGAGAKPETYIDAPPPRSLLMEEAVNPSERVAAFLDGTQPDLPPAESEFITLLNIILGLDVTERVDTTAPSAL